MSGKWHTVQLGELVSVKHGWPFKSKLFAEDLTGLPIVVNIGNFRYSGGFRFESTTVKEYRGTYPAEFELMPGDTLMVMTCQTPGGEILGIPGRVPSDDRTYLHNQRLGKVVVEHPEQVDKDFLYWLFHWSEFNRHLFITASGSKILHTAPSRIESFAFDLPPLREQRAIAHILGTLEDKIDLNRRMNETLEEIARAIFKLWFVDFDPVRAKAMGRDPGLPEHIADLFPDRFEDSELGEIPKGWKVGKFEEMADAVRSSVVPAETPDLEFEHFSLPAFDNGRQPNRELGKDIKSAKYRVPEDAIPISKLNPEIERVWMVDAEHEERAICSTEFIVLRARTLFSRSYLYWLCRSSSFRTELASLVTGTSKSHQRVQPSVVAALETLVPSPEAL